MSSPSVIIVAHSPPPREAVLRTALQLFTEPEILSSFSTAVNTSYTPNIYIYTVAFTNNNLNYAAALSVLVGVITVVATAVFLGLNRLRQRRAGIS